MLCTTPQKKQYKNDIIRIVMLVVVVTGSLMFFLYEYNNAKKNVREVELPNEDLLLPDYDYSNSKCGYKNLNNGWVIPPQYDAASFFTNKDIAIVTLDGKHYLIDKEGNIKNHINLDQAYRVERSYQGLVESDSIPFIDFGQEGTMVIDYYIKGVGRKQGFMDENGNVEECVVGNGVSQDNKVMESKGLYKVYQSGNNYLDHKEGYMKADGEMVIPFVYDSLGAMAENGYICAEISDKYGFLDENGDVIIALKYDGARDFGKNGLAPVKEGDKWGYINEDGEMVISSQYDWAEEFQENNLAMVEKDEKWGYIDENGREVIPIEYDTLTEYNCNNIVGVCKDEKWGCMNEKGNEIIPIEYDEIDIGFCLNESQYETYPDIYLDDIIVVAKEGRWGCVNKKNEIIIPMEYAECHLIAGDLMWVSDGEEDWFVNKKGEVMKEKGKIYDIDEVRQSGLLVMIMMENDSLYIDYAGNILAKD